MKGKGVRGLFLMRKLDTWGIRERWDLYNLLFEGTIHNFSPLNHDISAGGGGGGGQR